MKTNNQLYTDIMEKLEFEPTIDASKITVAVHDGVVTLGGTVGNYVEKRAVERAINSLHHVKGIANELEVNLLESFRRSDVDIAKAVIDSLAWHIMVPHERIKVKVEKGRVTLSGEVDWKFQAKNAEKAARNIIGVTDINNHIKIKPKIVEHDVEEKIVREFKRNAEIDARNIRIKALRDKVILKGSVHSWMEAQEAARAAWAVPGVTDIENHLIITYS